MDFRRQSMRPGDAHGQQAHRIGQPLAMFPAERSHRALDRGSVRYDIVRAARMDLGHRDHHRIVGIELAGHQGLQRSDNLAGNRDRIARLMRHRSMAARALDGDLEHVGRRQQGPRPARDNAVRRIGHDMERKGGIGQWIKQAIIEHEACTVKALLARLEHEAHFALERICPGTKQLCRADKHSSVGIVSAGMHFPGHGRGECQSGFLGHRQGVHIAAQQHRAAAIFLWPSPALERGDHAACRWSVTPCQRQMRQGGTHLGAGLRGHQTQFGFGMNGAAQRDNAVAAGPCLLDQQGLVHGALP